MFWLRNDKDMGDLGILLAEKWVEAIFDVKRVSDRIMLIKIFVKNGIVTVLLVYALQAGLDDSMKDLFSENLQWTLTKISACEIFFVCRDFSSHFGKNVDGYKRVRGGRGLGRHNQSVG